MLSILYFLFIDDQIGRFFMVRGNIVVNVGREIIIEGSDVKI